MFERFTHEAREVVVGAQEVARRLDHPRIGTEHLLISLLEGGGWLAGLLNDHGLTVRRAEAAVGRHRGNAPGMLGPADAAALKVIGIDLDAVRAHLEENFGPEPLAPPPAPPPRRRFGLRRSRPDEGGAPKGHIPFSPRAKKVLELSLREALRLADREIRTEHILLGLIREGEGLAALVLAGADIDLKDLRVEVEQRMPKRAA
ncbi:Clp protease [Virgisporangium ochraceum]|uniref:Clp protease n=1 Tax=Virgisporangium ochraceum TaxID=65505 RepID=A0A8J3ZTC9_9ACTN|nr:Clp protease [Virgisporangium ochraceum]